MEITQLIDSITWSGDYTQCTRTLRFEMLSYYPDKNIPSVPCELGDAVTFMYGNRVLFQGYVFDRQKGTEQKSISITCYDAGIYLKRNETSKKYKGITPEAVTKSLCREFGINTGAIVPTQIAVTRNFVGVSLYQIIQTAYTLAAEKTGKNYMIRFDGLKLTVIEKKKDENTLILAAGKNLMSAIVTESISSMINQVAVYNSDDVLIKSVKDEELINRYGLMQGYLRQSDGEDAVKKAERILSDNGLSQKITVNNLGNTANITGGTVVVKEPYTGLYGLFYIDADVHTWKRGQYYNKLTLNFKNIMDEQEAGTLPNKDGTKTQAGTPQTQSDGGNAAWEYLYKPGGV